MNRRCPPWLLAGALAAAGILPACQRPEEPLRPADLVPRPQLVGALIDLHLLEAQVENAASASTAAVWAISPKAADDSLTVMARSNPTLNRQALFVEAM